MKRSPKGTQTLNARTGSVSPPGATVEGSKRPVVAVVNETEQQLIREVENYASSLNAACAALREDEMPLEDVEKFFEDIEPEDMSDDEEGYVVLTNDMRDAAREYLDDLYNITGRWEGSSKEDLNYLGCTVLLAGGGPHIELDTADGRVNGYWGGDETSASVNTEVSDYYDAIVEFH
jgi:hypothetical protein